MGYFANGSEGEMYREQYCEQCIHEDDCAVWDLHLLSNYEECNNKRSPLHVLIPREGCGNGKCRMFVEKL